MKHLTFLAAGLVLGPAVGSCLAVPILTFNASPADLSRLAPGSTLTISVALAQPEVVDHLDSLAATVVFDSSLLGAPIISRGAILPDPLDDPLDFLSLAEPGSAEAAFSTLSLDPARHITQNGIFYSFTVEALRAGAGDFSFDFADGTRFNSADPASPLTLDLTAGPLLSFTIVPKPQCRALAASILFMIWLMGIRRRVGRLAS